jgi:uncharacterized protein HemX
MKHHPRSSGSVLRVVLVVLVLVAAGGGFLGWSFQQKQEFRPFGSFSEEDLQALVVAHDDKFDQLDEHYRNLASRRADVRDQGLLRERVREFERVQSMSEETREAGQEVSFVMSAQRDLDRELWIREHPIRFFWETATGF